jgi:rod shape-determining protein MreB
MELSLFRSWNSRQFAIDLGTANTLVFVPGEGIVVDEPSVVAVELVNGVQRVRSVGSDAKTLIGKTGDNIRTCRPLSDGVIKDLDLAEQMIRHFIEKAAGGRTLMSRGPEIAIGVPAASTEVERRVIQAAALNAGAREVWLIEEPMAAAIGAGLPVDEPVGSIVVDIGGGTTGVGIIALKRATYSISERVGGDKMDDAVAAYVRMKYNLEIGLVSAESIKKEIGSASTCQEAEKIVGHVGGRDVTAGSLREVELTADLPDPLHPCTILLCLPKTGATVKATSAPQPAPCATVVASPDKLASDPEEGGQVARTAREKPKVSDMTVSKRTDTASTKIMDSAAPASNCAPLQH